MNKLDIIAEEVKKYLDERTIDIEYYVVVNKNPDLDADIYLEPKKHPKHITTFSLEELEKHLIMGKYKFGEFIESRLLSYEGAYLLNMADVDEVKANYKRLKEMANRGGYKSIESMKKRMDFCFKIHEQRLKELEKEKE